MPWIQVLLWVMFFLFFFYNLIGWLVYVFGFTIKKNLLYLFYTFLSLHSPDPSSPTTGISQSFDDTNFILLPVEKIAVELFFSVVHSLNFALKEITCVWFLFSTTWAEEWHDWFDMRWRTVSSHVAMGQTTRDVTLWTLSDEHMFVYLFTYLFIAGHNLKQWNRLFCQVCECSLQLFVLLFNYELLPHTHAGRATPTWLPGELFWWPLLSSKSWHPDVSTVDMARDYFRLSRHLWSSANQQPASCAVPRDPSVIPPPYPWPGDR